jgi:hypothetical protein
MFISLMDSWPPLQWHHLNQYDCPVPIRAYVDGPNGHGTQGYLHVGDVN